MCSTFSKATQPFDFIRPSLIRKLANKVKYISQINRGLVMFFWKFQKNIFFKITVAGSIVNNMERINTVFKALE